MTTNIASVSHPPKLALGVLFGTILLFLVAIFFLGDYALKGSRTTPEQILGIPLPSQFELEHAFTSQEGETLQVIDRENKIRITVAKATRGVTDLDQLLENVFHYQNKRDFTVGFLSRFAAAHLPLKRLRSEKRAEITEGVPFQFFSEGEEEHLAVGVIAQPEIRWVVLVRHPHQEFTEASIQNSLTALLPFYSGG